MNQYNNKPLVLFYSNTPRAFRTTLIGHLYEISQFYPVILLSEDLDPNALRIIKDKKYFPNIKKIVPLHQHTASPPNIFSKNRYLCLMARTIIRDYSPDIVIASSDWHSLFEMYLMRFAKRINALKVTFQDTFNIADIKKIGMWNDLLNSHCRLPLYLPHWFRSSFVKFRKYLGHILIYWILPMLNCEPPFCGKASYILHKGHSGSRDSDYHVVLTKRDYSLYRKSGVPPYKLCILPHPLTRRARKVFAKIILSANKERCKRRRRVVTVMLPAEEIGFSRKNYSLIKKEERIKSQTEVFEILTKILKGCKIIIKPHPAIKNYLGIKQRIESISGCIEVVNPNEPADKYIDLGDIIIELPRAVSTTLFSASLQCPEKPILALDLHNEFLGDCYRDFNGVEYINNIEKLVSILERIRDNRYTKGTYETDEPNMNRFSDTIEILEYFIEKKRRAMPIIN